MPADSSRLLGIIRSVVRAERKELEAFVERHKEASWYLLSTDGTGLVPGTVPLDPACVTTSGWADELKFDMSLSTCEIDDPERLRPHMMAALRDGSHCSLVCASGAGKTKTVQDFLRVRIRSAVYCTTFCAFCSFRACALRAFHGPLAQDCCTGSGIHSVQVVSPALC
jgi:hypothetical protein